MVLMDETVVPLIQRMREQLAIEERSAVVILGRAISFIMMAQDFFAHEQARAQSQQGASSGTD